MGHGTNNHEARKHRGLASLGTSSERAPSYDPLERASGEHGFARSRGAVESPGVRAVKLRRCSSCPHIPREAGAASRGRSTARRSVRGRSGEAAGARLPEMRELSEDGLVQGARSTEQDPFAHGSRKGQGDRHGLGGKPRASRGLGRAERGRPPSSSCRTMRRGRRSTRRGYAAEIVFHPDRHTLFDKLAEVRDARGLTFVHPFDDPVAPVRPGSSSWSLRTSTTCP